MIINKLELMDFRNYDALNIELSDGVNIFFGDNAQGKTNILEAIYLCCTTRSQKRSHDKDMIRFGEEEAHLKMFINKMGLDRKIDLHLIKNKAKNLEIQVASPAPYNSNLGAPRLPKIKTQFSYSKKKKKKEQ